MLRTEIEALKSTTPQAQLRIAEGHKQHTQALAAAVETIRHFDREVYNASIRRFDEVRMRYEQASHSSFAGIAIPGILKKEWKDFVQAGEEYLRTLGNAAYPEGDAACIYCRQPLGSEAIKLLKKYRDYCNGEYRADIERAEEELVRFGHAILSLDPDALEARLTELGGPANVLTPHQREQVQAFLEQTAQLREAMNTRREFANPDLCIQADAVAAEIGATGNAIDALISDLKDRSAKREQNLKDRQAHLLDIESRVTLARLRPEIDKFVQLAQWADKARIQARRFQGILRSC